MRESWIKGRKGRSLIYNIIKKKKSEVCKSLNSNSPCLVLYRQGKVEVVLRGFRLFPELRKEGRN